MCQINSSSEQGWRHACNRSACACAGTRGDLCDAVGVLDRRLAMRMLQPPTLPVSNTDDGKATGAEQVPITDITLATGAADPADDGAAATPTI